MKQYDLELLKIGKVYPGGNVAVEAFDLQVEPGRVYFLCRPLRMRQDNDAEDDRRA